MFSSQKTVPVAGFRYGSLDALGRTALLVKKNQIRSDILFLRHSKGDKEEQDEDRKKQEEPREFLEKYPFPVTVYLH